AIPNLENLQRVGCSATVTFSTDLNISLLAVAVISAEIYLKMSFAVDDEVLANIKVQEDSDNEVFGAVFAEEEKLKDDFLDPIELQRKCENYCEDPLQHEEKIDVKDFPWQYEESDFLRSHILNGDDVESCEVKKEFSKGKPKKPNKIQWSKEPGNTILNDLPDYQPSGKGPAKNVFSPVEAWHLLMDLPILTQIVKATNEFIKSLRSKELHHKTTDVIELRSWIGLNYLCGVLHNNENARPIEELWTLELGNAVFRASMQYKRFVFLAESIRISDTCPDSNKLPSIIDEIGTVWEKFIINCRSYYTPSNICMLDDFVMDSSVDFFNSFEYSSPSEDERNCVRFVTLCDAKTLYISNALITRGNKYLDEEVYQISSDIKNTRRCLCINDRYTNINMMINMGKLQQTQLQVVGSLSRTEGMPTHLVKSMTTPQVWYSKNDLILISGCETEISQAGLLLASGLSTRVSAIKLYKIARLSNRRAHNQMNIYNTAYGNAALTQLGWARKFLYFLLNMAAFNAWILMRLSEKGDSRMEQRDFQRQLEVLGEDVEAVLSGIAKQRTLQLPAIPADKVLIPEGVVLQARENESRRRCRGCRSRNGTKIRTRCQQCLIPYCMRHLISRCDKCSGVAQCYPAECLKFPPFLQDYIIGDIKNMNSKI
uniref:DDE_Tnp_1_7 domain-containing protein n=1 Tax=Glossina pallidipes TaxID=7398 RepID=A0A1A9ZVJ0_GLOPL